MVDCVIVEGYIITCQSNTNTSLLLLLLHLPFLKTIKNSKKSDNTVQCSKVRDIVLESSRKGCCSSGCTSRRGNWRLVGG